MILQVALIQNKLTALRKITQKQSHWKHTHKYPKRGLNFIQIPSGNTRQVTDEKYTQPLAITIENSGGLSFRDIVFDFSPTMSKLIKIWEWLSLLILVSWNKIRATIWKQRLEWTEHREIDWRFHTHGRQDHILTQYSYLTVRVCVANRTLVCQA